jgi:hypothetical protein
MNVFGDLEERRRLQSGGAFGSLLATRTNRILQANERPKCGPGPVILLPCIDTGGRGVPWLTEFPGFDGNCVASPKPH